MVKCGIKRGKGDHYITKIKNASLVESKLLFFNLRP